MFIFWLKEMYSKIVTNPKFNIWALKLDSDQYGEAHERGASTFGKESNLLLESDPD
jgi:hypothetical protein